MPDEETALPPTTEYVSPLSIGIDTWPPKDILRRLWQDQMDGLAAVRPAISDLEAAAKAMADRLHRDGSRLIYVGAGTSGVLAALDGIELPCTYGWPAERLEIFRADDADNILRIATAGDDEEDAARRASSKAGISPNDVIIAVSASGDTRYTCTFAHQAKDKGALVVGVANNAESALLALADHAVLLGTGPEVIAGSTRMKAGTAQKAALNMLSTLTMTLLGRVHDGMMIDVMPENDKLRKRAARMVVAIAGVDAEKAAAALREADGHVKTAVFIAKGMTLNQAREILSDAGQNLRKALIDVAGK